MFSTAFSPPSVFSPWSFTRTSQEVGAEKSLFSSFCSTQTSQAADVQARPLQQPGAPFKFLPYKLSNDESCTSQMSTLEKFQKFLIQVRTAQTRHLERPLPRPSWRPNPSMHLLQPPPHSRPSHHHQGAETSRPLRLKSHDFSNK